MNRDKLLSIGLIVLGLVVLVVGVVQLVNSKSYLPTTATIYKITETSDWVGDEVTYSYEVIVDYSVDGQDYRQDLGYHENGFVEGQQIDITYNPNDPTKIQPASNGFAIYLVIIGPVLIAASVFMLIKKKA